MQVDRVTLTAGGTTLAVFEVRGDNGAAADGLLDELRPRIDELLGTTGVVLLRGFEIATPGRLHAVAGRFGDPLTNYRGGDTPRSTVIEGVFTSTEYPAEYEISLHNEMSYAHTWPQRLYFCCMIAAETGGRTPVCDGRALLAELDPAVRDRFVERGVTYRQHLHGGYGLGKSWQQTFETEDRHEVESFLEAASITFDWTDDGGLRTAARRPATRTYPATGETVWFNQADQWHLSNLPPAEREALIELVDSEADLPHSVAYGDGQPISVWDLDQVRAAAKKHELSVPWQRGDVMIVENMLVLHGRHPYTGPRRILVAMT